MRLLLLLCALVALLEVVAAGRRQAERLVDGALARRAKRHRSRRPHRARRLARNRPLRRRGKKPSAHAQSEAFAAVGALGGAAALSLAHNATARSHNASSNALPAGLAALYATATTQRSCPHQADTGAPFKDGGSFGNLHYCASSAGKSPDYLYWCVDPPALARG